MVWVSLVVGAHEGDEGVERGVDLHKPSVGWTRVAEQGLEASRRTGVGPSASRWSMTPW